MKLRHLFVLCCAATIATCAQADIYKRVDEDGHVTYSSVPLKGAQKLHLEPLPTMTPTTAPRNGDGSSGFRVNSETQSRRDAARRKILEDELATEQKALEDSRAKLKEGQSYPQMFMGDNGQPVSDPAKVQEKVNNLQDEVSSHEKNIEALKTELSHLNN